MASKTWNIGAFPLSENRFPLSTEDVEWALNMMDLVGNTVFRPSVPDVEDFFGAVARIGQEIFKSQIIRVWDNNVYGNCLVMLASHPLCEVQRAQFTISRDWS